MTIRVRKIILIVIGIITIVLMTFGLMWYFDPKNVEYEDIFMKPSLDISENIIRAVNNKTFADYITKEGYDKFLHDAGPFTVFVPTDEAYENLPQVTKDIINNPDEEGTLRYILLHHVVKGQYLASDLQDGLNLETLTGEALHIAKNGNMWSLDGYSYIDTYDIKVKNGVIHLVTNYLIPDSIVLQ